MIRKPITVDCIISIVLIAASYAGPTMANGADNEPGYVSLFNGKNLDGWVIENNARFSVHGGLLALNKGTGWLRSEQEYADFVFKMDFRFLEEKANSGIFVRTGSTSKKDENGWPDNGYQVQCMDIVSGANPLAKLIPYGAPPFESETDVAKLAKVYRPDGKWNTYEIKCVGEELRVKLNGQLVTTASKIKNLRGHLGIQAEHGRLEFRNLRVMVIEGASKTEAAKSAAKSATKSSR